MKLAVSLLLITALAGCGSDPKPAPLVGRRIAVEVTKTGYVPNTLSAASGERVVLVFTRTADTSCGQYITLRGDDTRTELPLNQPVEVPLTMPKDGEIVFQCHMDMMHGIIAVNDSAPE